MVKVQGSPFKVPYFAFASLVATKDRQRIIGSLLVHGFWLSLESSGHLFFLPTAYCLLPTDFTAS
jgi:hypothetical protein